jgi:4-hydroxy-3-methylbut-2-enyl diphosphate reductase
MAIKVEIDHHSGFCAGVIRAIGKAEDYLDDSPEKRMYSLGAIVHNEAELERLSAKGLVTITSGTLDNTNGVDLTGETLLIRAHGEPPATYSKARQMGLNIIDCTCPVVLELQKSIREAYIRLHEGGKKGQVVIFGKIGHAEVLGLVGQVDSDATVVENRLMLEAALNDGVIDLNGPVEIFSQTTKSPAEYSEICAVLEERMAKAHELPLEQFKGTNLLRVHNTICRQVASRHENLSDFAKHHDVVIFVADKASSNGQVLCDLCKSLNIRTYRISAVDEIRKEWFRADDNVGVSGATSTPKWLLEDVATAVLALNGYL